MTTHQSLPEAIICDIDGTLAHMNGRSPYDWDRVGEDTVDEVVRETLQMYEIEYDIILVSGRKDTCKRLTVKWLHRNFIPFSVLHMRKADDNRSDVEVKGEIYETLIKPHYNVRLVLDDRDSVVKMWRSKGLKCYQVAEGNF